MENCSFQAQLVSVVDILAKAALSEIHRRVDDSCAILRLEITQSQRDIDTLKRKCQLMDGELKRTRIRLRRKGFNTMAAERHPPQIKILLNKEKNVSVWAREMAVEELIHHPPESTDGEPQPDIEPILIKDEVDEDLIGIREEFRITGEDFGTKTGLTPLIELPICEADTQSLQTENSEQYNSVDNPEEPVSMLPSTDKYDLFPGQQPDGDKDDIDLMVKNEKEDEPDQSTILIGSDFGMDDRPLWPSNVGRDIPDLYATEQYQQSSFAFPPQCGLQLVNNVTDDAGPQPHAVGKSNYNMVSSARAKRRSRTFGSKQKHQAMHIHEHGQHSGRANSMGENSMTPHVGQHQYRASEPGVSSNEGLSGSNIVTPTLPAYSRTNFNLARRMRAHWRSGVGEKRFSCTYCTKSFMRFSQLKEHLRSHTGEKPFSCLQCGRSFTKQCNLIRHAVVHSGEKPYECGQCGKCFTQRSSMKSHQKTHVGAGDVSMHVLPSYGGDTHTSLMVPQTRCYK